MSGTESTYNDCILDSWPSMSNKTEGSESRHPFPDETKREHTVSRT